jgi:hypothetical protein
LPESGKYQLQGLDAGNGTQLLAAIREDLDVDKVN